LKRIYQISLLAVLVVTVLATNSPALVEWNRYELLKTDAPPVDVAISKNGKWIFVLTAAGDILIHTPEGKLQDTVGVGKHIDQIEVGPREDLLVLKSRKKQTVEILILDFIRDISTSGSPFKGPADAPVVIAVFSDFE
jgi:hypothetical protein